MISPVCLHPTNAKYLIVMMTVTVLMADLTLAERPEPEVHGVFDGDPMYTVLPPDQIPAIQEPEFVTGAAANEQMHPDEPVLGVVLGGEAHAYSLWQLDHHEIVNDTLAGTAIAATW